MPYVKHQQDVVVTGPSLHSAPDSAALQIEVLFNQSDNRVWILEKGVVVGDRDELVVQTDAVHYNGVWLLMGRSC